MNLYKKCLSKHLFTLLISIYFILVNALFLYKYGMRLDSPMFLYLSIFIYVLILFVFLFRYSFFNLIFKKIGFRISYLSITILGVFCIVIITNLVDRESLNVDRWSAMEVAIRALFSGEYPYTAVDHLGGRTSNFPGLLLLGIPFYLLGDVGYLQAFSLLLFSFTLYKVLPIERALRTLLLLFISLGFWYEVAVISDFISNIIIVMCAIMLWNHYFKNNIYKRYYLLAILMSVLVLTRGIAFIPIALYLTAPFFKVSNSVKFKFIITAVVCSSILIYLTVINVPDFEVLSKFNPLVLQTSYTPLYINLIAILLPCVLSFKIGHFYNQFFSFSFGIIAIIVIYTFISNLFHYDFNTLIHGSKFDLVYLSCVFPFIWVLLGNRSKV